MPEIAADATADDLRAALRVAYKKIDRVEIDLETAEEECENVRNALKVAEEARDVAVARLEDLLETLAQYERDTFWRSRDRLEVAPSVTVDDLDRVVAAARSVF
jgi:uncharacterized protein (DUF3084 family)